MFEDEDLEAEGFDFLSDDAKELLNFMKEHDGASTAEVQKGIGWEPDRLKEALEELESLGHISLDFTGLTPELSRLCRVIMDNPGVRVNSLATMFEWPAAKVQASLDQLQAAGYISVRSQPVDLKPLSPAVRAGVLQQLKEQLLDGTDFVDENDVLHARDTCFCDKCVKRREVERLEGEESE